MKATITLLLCNVILYCVVLRYATLIFYYAIKFGFTLCSTHTHCSLIILSRDRLGQKGMSVSLWLEKGPWPLFPLCFKTIALGSRWGNKVNFDSICLLLYMMLHIYYTLTKTISNNFLKKGLKSILHSGRAGRSNPSANRMQAEAEKESWPKLTETTQLTYRQGPLEAPTKCDKIFKLLCCCSSGLWLINITIGITRILTHFY